jgi:hypothetical protein
MLDPLADLPAFHVEWHIPPNREPDHYALELLSAVLGDGDSSRLYRSLVHESEILSEIGVGTDDRRGPDLFSIFGLVQEGHTAEEARTQIYAAIADIAAHGVPDREMERIRNRMRAYFVVNVQSNLMRAEHLAEYELYYGDATLLRTELDRYLAAHPAGMAAPEMHYLRGDLSLRLGDCAAARRDLAIALRAPADPWAAAARDGLARCGAGSTKPRTE